MLVSGRPDWPDTIISWSTPCLIWPNGELAATPATVTRNRLHPNGQTTRARYLESLAASVFREIPAPCANQLLLLQNRFAYTLTNKKGTRTHPPTPPHPNGGEEAEGECRLCPRTYGVAAPFAFVGIFFASLPFLQFANHLRND